MNKRPVLRSFYPQVFKQKNITAHSFRRRQLSSHSRNCHPTAPFQSSWSTHAHSRHALTPICNVLRSTPVLMGRGE
jgi:hypothetical protein